MRTPKLVGLGASVALAAASLTLGATAASSASPAGGTAPPTISPATAVPDPNAVHVGTVAGVRSGPHISITNPTSIRAFRELHARMLPGGRASLGRNPETIHEYVGTSFNTDTVGAQATQSVSPKIEPAHPGTTLYTPTIYPSGGSCIEVSTAYFFASQVVAAWDWCKAITFVAELPIDRRFMRTYTLHRNYSVQIARTDAGSNTWTSYLYNYESARWERFFTQNGTSQVGLAEGWDLYELYSDVKGNGQSYACGDLRNRRVEARGIKVGVDGRWVRAQPGNAGDHYDVPLSEFHCRSLHYQMMKPFSHWKAVG